MRKFIFFTTILSFSAIFFPVVGENSQRQDSDRTGKQIALVNSSNTVAQETMRRLREYAEQELRVETEIVPKTMPPNLSLAKCARQFEEATKMKTEYPIIVVFYASPKDEKHIHTTESKQISVINTPKLKSSDAERYARRLERLMLRSAGKAAGLGFDPDPRCVMHSYRTVEDLDRMGRNFSPPWMEKFRQSAKNMGLESISHKTTTTPDKPIP